MMLQFKQTCFILSTSCFLVVLALAEVGLFSLSIVFVLLILIGKRLNVLALIFSVHIFLFNLCFFRWLSLSSQYDLSTMSLSSSACPMMLCVRDRLLNLRQVLSLSLFQLAWQGLAERLDNFLYQDVRD